MLGALRYRRGQALVVLVLSALVTACAVFAPLYTRALEQAVVATLLDEAPVAHSGVRMSSTSASDPFLAQYPSKLAERVPADIRAVTDPGIASHAVEVRRMPLAGEPDGLLLWRDRMCEHVEIALGRCPHAAGEILVSADQAVGYAQHLGAEFDVGEWDASVSKVEAAPTTTVRVVGVYRPRHDDPYWFGDPLTGRASTRLGFDVMLTSERTLTERVTSPDRLGQVEWVQPHYGLDLALRTERVDVDRIGPLGASAARFVDFPLGLDYAGTHAADAVTVTTGLPAIAAEVAIARDQAGVTVPVLMGQLALLLGCVLWLVLLAGADQRRAEVAVARLRGRGAAGARRLLLGETLPPVIAGVPVGIALAVGLSVVARRAVLTPDTPSEFPHSAAVGALIAVAGMVALAVLSVQRIARAPIADLLRSVSAGRSGVRMGLLEAMLVAAAGATFAAMVTGSISGPIGQVAPMLLAVAVGVVAARVLPALLAGVGRGLLRRGWAPSGAALLQASRRSATRWLVPLVTVALCLVVVATDALAVAARNRHGRAEAEVGAARVLSVDSADLAAVRSAVRAVDPGGEHVTAVAVIAPLMQDGVVTVGVDVDAFPRVALWPGRAPGAFAWSRLTGPVREPLRVKGTEVTYHVASGRLESSAADPNAVPDVVLLGLRIVKPDGGLEVMPLHSVPVTGVDADQRATLACAGGCRIAGIGVLAPPAAAPIRGAITVSDLAVDGVRVGLGDSETWLSPTDGDTTARGTVAAGALTIDFANAGRTETFLSHASMPGVVPSLTTPVASPSARNATFGGSLMDGGDLLLTSIGTVPFIPGGPAKAAVVNVAQLLVQGWQGRGSAQVRVYADTADPRMLGRVRDSLHAAGIAVVGEESPERVAAAYGRTGAAWSLDLSLAVAVLALLVACVGLLVLVASSARTRARDYAGLAMAGFPRRSVAMLAVLETVPVIVICGLLGAGTGLWSAPAALDLVPLFPSAPPTFPLDLRTAWAPSLLAAAVALGVLVLVGALASLRVAGSARLDRLREIA